MKKPIKIALISLGSLLMSSALAGGVEKPAVTHNLYLSAIGGANWTYSGSRSTTVNFGGLATNLYQANRSKAAVGSLVGVGFGAQWSYPTYWWSIGAELDYTHALSSVGTVRPLYFINSNFDTLNYQYLISSIPLLGMAQIGWHVTKWFAPYLLGGLGVAWTRAYFYREVATDPALTASPMRAPFTNRTNTAFAATAGAGLNFRLNPMASISLEYRFSYYGKVYFSGTPAYAPNITASSRLSLSSLSANALLMRLTALIS